MSERARIALVLAALTVGCGSEDTTPPEDELREQICDGSQDLRLAWFRSNRGGVLRTPFQIELGFSYLYVRGDCEYWVTTTSGEQSHHGVLDAEQEAALAELVQYDDWDGLTQLWPDPGWDDVPLMVVDDGHGEYSIGCLGECPVAPEPVQEMQAAYRDELESMWQGGEPSTGPMRLLAAQVVEEGWEPNTVVPWTVDLDLSSVAVDMLDMEEPGMSALIEDPATLAELREFRAAHADELEQFSDFYVEVEPGVIYELYLRDAVPFEGADGLIPRYWGE